MIHCSGSPADEWLEPYLTGLLADEQAQAFEEHYFDCPECLARVQAMQAVGEALRRNPVQAPARKVLYWPTAFGALAAAAVLVLAVGLGYRALNGRAPAPQTAVSQSPVAPLSASTPSTAIASTPTQLADLELPPFRYSNLRGGVEDMPFLSGMQAYAKGDCQGALTKLARVQSGAADALGAEFYSGVCEIQQKEWARASATLRRVTGKGDSPEQEAAWYYLAQISLVREDLPSARSNLRQVISLRGDFEQRARQELERLPADSSPQ
jgi:hypothetical protein